MTRVLHVASEIAPFSKTGGLADVVAALPPALARLGHAQTVVTPLYRGVNTARFGLVRWLRRISVPLGAESVEVGLWEGRPPGGGPTRLFFVEHPASFDRDGIYGEAHGEFADNARRFVLLSRAALAIAAELDLWPDVVHAHDWQAAVALLYAKGSQGLPAPRTALTLHNLAFRGLFPPSVIDEVGLPAAEFHPDGYEFFGQVSLLKAGMVHADVVTTVSPRYAEEICEPLGGQGLDGFLRARRDRLVGILNGIDDVLWDPARDPQLPATYSTGRMAGKAICKRELQRELGLPQRAQTPLSGSVSRLTDQKGFDLVLKALPELLAERDMQYVVLGTGDSGLEAGLAEMAARFPTKMAVRIGYDEALAHRIEGGCDLYVMPSRFEPCGLNQMYSLRYGTPPIVRDVGGLHDTVVDWDGRSRSGTGFVFGPLEPQALAATWRRALDAYGQSGFASLVERAMAEDFSWARSAARYAAIYSP
jgi:starch synthase